MVRKKNLKNLKNSHERKIKEKKFAEKKMLLSNLIAFVKN